MPRTKFQDYVFTVIMVVCMVYCMTFYNIALEMGLSYAVFGIALKEMWIEAAAAFVAVKFLVNPVAKRMLGEVRKSGVTAPLLLNVSMAAFTVMMMCPIMTLFVSLLHNGFTPDFIVNWLPKLLVNFPFALIIQTFYVGPLVRLIFRTLFRNRLNGGNGERSMAA